jgi:hypothetical protein
MQGLDRNCCSGAVLLDSYEFLNNGFKKEKSYESRILLYPNTSLFLLRTLWQQKDYTNCCSEHLKLYQKFAAMSS